MLLTKGSSRPSRPLDLEDGCIHSILRDPGQRFQKRWLWYSHAFLGGPILIATAPVQECQHSEFTSGSACVSVKLLSKEKAGIHGICMDASERRTETAGGRIGTSAQIPYEQRAICEVYEAKSGTVGG